MIVMVMVIAMMVVYGDGVDNTGSAHLPRSVE
jgi:hypothetical protein